MFYHYRETADRRDKVGRLLEIALGDLQDSVTIEELSQALTKHGVDINSHAGQHGENPNTFSHTLQHCSYHCDLSLLESPNHAFASYFDRRRNAVLRGKLEGPARGCVRASPSGRGRERY